MNRKDMVAEMRTMLINMDSLLNRAGVGNVLSVPENAEKLTSKFVKDGHNWLSNLYSNQFTEALKVWKLLPEDLWKRYAVWGCFEDHRESKMLATALEAMRKVIMNQKRPAFFKKSVITKRLKSVNKIAGPCAS